MLSWYKYDISADLFNLYVVVIFYMGTMETPLEGGSSQKINAWGR